MCNTRLKSLFKEFINDSQSGKRLRKNGERIKTGTINNYRYTLKNIELFEELNSLQIKIYDYSRLDQEQRLKQKRWWKNFYQQFTQFLYEKGCHDNYVGANIKNIRTFFNYLNVDRDIITGNFYRQFYIRKEQTEILVLLPEQLKTLIHDKGFEKKLTPAEIRVKDAFVFGCISGLRFSDLYQLTNENLEKIDDEIFLKVKSQKTKAYSSVRLPPFAKKIIEKNKQVEECNKIFRSTSLFIFNRTLKKIGEKAGFTKPIHFKREKQGIPYSRYDSPIRFCDKMSSHMMRRTAITTMLTLGMPEHVVKNISGHSPNSKSFQRYVYYSDSFLDKEIDKFHSKLQQFKFS